MRINATITLPALMLSGLFLAGCYTVLIHPSVRSDEEYARGSIYWNDNCLKCHAPGEVEYFYTEIDRDGNRLPGSHETPWVYGPYSSFNYPWWFDSEWILTRHQGDYEKSEKERTGMHGGRFRGGQAERERDRNGSTGGATILPPGGGGGATRSSRQDTASGGTGADKSSGGSDTQTRSRDNSTSGQNSTDRTRDTGSSGNSSTPARPGSTRGR